MGDEIEGTGGNNTTFTSSSCCPPTPLINCWWDLHATSSNNNSLSSWSSNNNNNNINHDSNNNSSSCEEEISASNHSTLTVESPHHHHTLLDLPAAAASDNHLWSHLLLGMGSNNNNNNNLIDGLSSKGHMSMLEEPAYCDYLKKLDDHSTTSSTNWEYNSFDEKHNLNNININNNNGFSSEEEPMPMLSNLVTTWSIAPPQAHNNNINNSNSLVHFDPQTHNNNNIMDHSGIFPSYGSTTMDHIMKVKQEHLFGRSSCDHNNNNNNDNSSNIGYDDDDHQSGFFKSHAGGEEYDNNNNNGRFYYGSSIMGGGVAASNSSCTRNLTDVISFTGRLGRPIIGIHAFKPTLKSINNNGSSDHSNKKQGFHTSSGSRSNNGRGQGSATESKKKRSDDSSEAILKKPKQETSSSPTKVQAPKVKLGDRITTLQQIVSPFGKTDTASVLFEAIGYIKFLQEQVQLLSNSYVKSNSHKETWGNLERKEKGDLRSRGLCLVPISCTPQVYRDNTAPDYWTPAYRGCLYR